MRSHRNAPPTHVQPDPPVRAFYLANAGGGGPVNLVLLGHIAPRESSLSVFRPEQRVHCAVLFEFCAPRRAFFGQQRRALALEPRAQVSIRSRPALKPKPAPLRTPPRFGIMATSVAAASMLAPALCFEQHRGEVKHCHLSSVTVSNSKALWSNHAFNRTRRYGPSTWRSPVAAGRLTWSC